MSVEKATSEKAAVNVQGEFNQDPGEYVESHRHRPNPIAAVNRVMAIGKQRPQRKPTKSTRKSVIQPPSSIPTKPTPSGTDTMKLSCTSGTLCTSPRYRGSQVMRNAQPMFVVNCIRLFIHMSE